MTMKNAQTIGSLADDLENGRRSARKLVDACLGRIADTSGEGARTFIHVDAEAAIEAAEAMDRLREVKAAPSPYAGIPVSIKDLFDIKGQVTRAGSRALEDSAPAEADAPVVARLRRAGFVVIGSYNMTEFAYSGIGINPHYGTPKSTWNRKVGHVPGGSSSGAAVSVADGMAHGALGTDTGGSCRIPAAFNRIVGFKPTPHPLPPQGARPPASSPPRLGPPARTAPCRSQRPGGRTEGVQRARRSAHAAVWRVGAPCPRQHAAENRRPCRRQGVHEANPARAAQLHAAQHARRLRELPARASRGRGAGR